MFRFSLKTLFGTMVLAAVVLSALFALPPWAGCWLLLVATVVLGAAAAAGGCYGRGGTRAFCSAVFVAGGAALWLSGSPWPDAGLIQQPMQATLDTYNPPLIVPSNAAGQPLFGSSPWGDPAVPILYGGSYWINLRPAPSTERRYQFHLLAVWGLALLSGVTACAVRACCGAGKCESASVPPAPTC